MTAIIRRRKKAKKDGEGREAWRVGVGLASKVIRGRSANRPRDRIFFDTIRVTKGGSTALDTRQWVGVTRVEIVALIGPSGTGKSHRASMVADRYQADAILDDGLYIVDGRILAGRSAKSESTRVAAVKRAILLDPDHARDVREAMRAQAPERLLILGTSRRMVERIMSSLELNGHAVEVVFIDQIATGQEIETARQEREGEGRHVIPVPTLEVRKTFSGYLIAPLQFIFFRHGRGVRVAVEKSIVRPTYSLLGRFYIADTVLSAIAAHSADQCANVAEVGRVVVQSAGDGVHLNLEVTLAAPRDVLGVIGTVQSQVRAAIERMTALNVVEVVVEARQITGNLGRG